MIETINLKDVETPQIGTTCLICDGFVPVYDPLDTRIRVCGECKKRMMTWLYPERESQNE